MKRLFTMICLLASLGLTAQNFNNEWIDYSKTYYKFKLGATGLCRIPQATLAAAGVDITHAELFQLFRNGKEVPIYTSVPTGAMGGSDYIEFWGEMNDGAPDQPLYRNPAYQHNQKWSLETDTAVYFLTVNPAGGAFHFVNTPNNPSGSTLTPESYFLYKAATYFKQRINKGFASVVQGAYIYSSSYDIGEFWSTNPITPAAPLTDNQNNLYVYPGGPDASIRFGLAGAADNLRSISLNVNTKPIVSNYEMDSFFDLVYSAPVPLSDISGNSAAVQFINGSATPTDRMVASFYELVYPRQYNFGGQSTFNFELPAKSDGYLLNITNFNVSGSTTPILYDLTNGLRYAAVVGSGNSLSFLLGGSATSRKLVLVNEDASIITNIGGLTQKGFTNFANSSLQGNYLIISHPALYTGTSGNNPVNDYKAYRSSLSGGSFNAQVYDINELVDQFGFGIKKHPLSIQNFLRYARSNFSTPLQYVLLIGHGMSYWDYYPYSEIAKDPIADAENLVPTFGWPASDNKLAANNGVDAVQATPIGRLSVVSGAEIEIYLNKVKEYEQVQMNSQNTLDGKLWMKNVLQLTGASEPNLGSVLCTSIRNYQAILVDTLFGATVTSLCDGNAGTVTQVPGNFIPNLFTTGFSMLNYFGHSSNATLGYNLNNPQDYSNPPGKYPVFYINGCDAGDFFIYDPQRFGPSKTLSESWVLAKERGAIAFVASTHLGVVNYLDLLLNDLFTGINGKDYGKSIGIIEKDALQQTINNSAGGYFDRQHAEQMTLHGDPALKLNLQPLPDYDIEASQVLVNPSLVSVANSNFTLDARFYNLGKAVPDSVIILVQRQYPDGTSTILLKKKIPGIRYADSIHLVIPIIATRDKGLNKITVSVNPDGTIPEVTLTNNVAVVNVFIYQNEATPVYPYNYSIINTPTSKLVASTANPFSSTQQYVMDIDTTQQFNSPLKVEKFLTAPGGVMEFDPGISYLDSVVYYWRIGIVPSTPGGAYNWNYASFIYIDPGRSTTGFAQGHYFQHLNSTTNGMSLGGNRQWSFGTMTHNFYLKNAIFGISGFYDQDFSVSIDGNLVSYSACLGHSLAFVVIDPITLKPWRNVDANGNNLNLSGSAASNCGPGRATNFEFSYMTPQSRNLIMRFMDSIPNGFYVAIRSFDYDNPNSFSSTWRGDTTLFGSGKSLYHSLLNAGFTTIDSLNSVRCWQMIYKKGDNSFTPKAQYSQDYRYKISFSADAIGPLYDGTVTSPLFGPAKKWNGLHWRGTDLTTPATDTVGVTVIGIDTLGNSTNLYSLTRASQDFDLSAVDAAKYPFLQLKLTTEDTIHALPYQLQYWRLNGVPVPEGAIAPNILFKCQDTVNQGEQLNLAIAFKNVSPYAFDSMRIKMYVLDRSNVMHLIPLPRKKPLVSGDTLTLVYSIDTKAYPGANTLYVDFNPNDQPEQYFFNNFLYKNFYVRSENRNPLLDITFDNIHILNEDIVSARPHIQIQLHSQSQYVLLNDTSLITVQVRYPDGSLHPYSFSSDTLRFTPASSGNHNVATVDFYPVFTKQYNPSGDDYQLIVTGKDPLGNNTGAIPYRVNFKIITKPMISNMLNYPNPFTTSTAFVFTITGSEVPQNIKIQILTITGKIVREITKDELGPLHVGRNITEFKWNGTDMYGQRLANGVYLYHVVTNLNGKSLDKYQASGDNTDKYFNNGYGKMYLMK